MRYLSIFLFGLVLVPSVAAANERLTPRPLDPIAIDAFALAQANSATVRSLVATLEASNVIVHIESSRILPLGIGGTTRFVTSRGGYRYVRIAIAVDLPRASRPAILAHELQHACEVAASGADDHEGIKQFFEREGYHSGGYYDTQRAINVERRVRFELKAGTIPTRLGIYSPSQ